MIKMHKIHIKYTKIYNYFTKVNIYKAQDYTL